MEIPLEAHSRVPRLAIRTNQRPLNVYEARKFFRTASGWALMLAALLSTLRSTGYAQQGSS
jgi:hypothetical protein